MGKNGGGAASRRRASFGQTRKCSQDIHGPLLRPKPSQNHTAREPLEFSVLFYDALTGSGKSKDCTLNTRISLMSP